MEYQVSKRILEWAYIYYFILIFCILLSIKEAFATSTFCAVTRETKDGFVSLRVGPAATYKQIGTLFPSDFLYVGTELCRADFGAMLCSNHGRWIFVEAVKRFKNFSNMNLKGWANSSLIRQVQCPDE